MTDVALIDHTARCQRAWGLRFDGRHYRADVLVLPLANELPPAWASVELGPLPAPTVPLVDWFMFNVAPHVAQRACELVSAELHEITEAEFVELEDAWKPCVPVAHATTPELAVEDFAGPNRAQRRAQAKPKRRRR